MKIKFKYAPSVMTVITALTIFTVSLTCSAAAAAATTAPPRGHIDSPAGGSYISNSVTIKGWSISASGVKTVAIYINGKKAGNAATGIRRDDINQKYNSGGAYAGAKYCGFSYLLNTSAYSAGTYKVTVSSISKSGSTYGFATSYKKCSPLIHIDSPKSVAAGTGISTDFTINGWSLNTSGVSRVDIAADGKKVGGAQPASAGRTSTDRSTPPAAIKGLLKAAFHTK